MSQVNSYGHGRMVSSSNHSGREENDRRNYFTINLHESMGPCWDRTRDPLICSQTCICSQTHDRLCYAARSILIQMYTLLGAQKNHLIEMVLLSAHNTCFGLEIFLTELECVNATQTSHPGPMYGRKKLPQKLSHRNRFFFLCKGRG